MCMSATLYLQFFIVSNPFQITPISIEGGRSVTLFVKNIQFSQTDSDWFHHHNNDPSVSRVADSLYTRQGHKWQMTIGKEKMSISIQSCFHPTFIQIVGSL